MRNWVHGVKNYNFVRQNICRDMMHIYSLNYIQERVEYLAGKILAPKQILPSYGRMEFDSHPFIESRGDGLYYVRSERGQEFERKYTEKLDDLLFWVFESVTHELASKYAARNGPEDKDFRRMMFEKQEELLGILNIDWRFAVEEEHNKILTQHPFDDLSGLRAIYCGELRSQGLPELEIQELAYKKYPRPANSI